jgi:hypothetical protein
VNSANLSVSSVEPSCSATIALGLVVSCEVEYLLWFL